MFRLFFQNNFLGSAKVNRITIVLLAVISLAGVLHAEILANQNKQGLRAYTIERVLRMQEDEIDLATAALILSRDWGSPRTSHVYRRKIDDMAEAILKRLREKNTPVDYRAIPIINEYLFDEIGFKTVSTADDPEDLFLHVVLDKKRGYCLSLSVLYLSIAERLGLPMYGVVVPEHFFVRYDDGRRQYNIETTSNGGIAADEHYIKEFAPPTNPRTLYMRNLTKKETLGCFFNNLGNSYTAVGDTDKAFKFLLHAVQINPLLSEANINLGNIYLKKKMPLQAIEQYEKALRILGSDAKAINNLGTAYIQLGEYAKAESYYKTALSLDPQYVDVYRNLANAMQLQGRYTDAVSQLKVAVVLNPDDADSLLLLGQICRQIQQYPDAEKYLLDALAVNPLMSLARVSLGYVYLDQNRLGLAQKTFQTALTYEQALPLAYFGLAQIACLNEQLDDEIRNYEQALCYDPYMISALQNLGNAYVKNNDLDAAVQAYQKALQVQPENSDLHYNLGVTLAKMQQHQRAIASFSKAIELDSQNASAYNGMAISYYQLKNKELAGVYAHKAKALGYEVQQELLELN